MELYIFVVCIHHEKFVYIEKGKSPALSLSLYHPPCICHTMCVRYNTHKSDLLCVVKCTSRRHTNSSVIFWMVKIWAEGKNVVFSHAHAHHKIDMHPYIRTTKHIHILLERKSELNHMYTAVWYNNSKFMGPWKFEWRTLCLNGAGAKSETHFPQWANFNMDSVFLV